MSLSAMAMSLASSDEDDPPSDSVDGAGDVVVSGIMSLLFWGSDSFSAAADVSATFCVVSTTVSHAALSAAATASALSVLLFFTSMLILCSLW